MGRKASATPSNTVSKLTVFASGTIMVAVLGSFSLSPLVFAQSYDGQNMQDLEESLQSLPTHLEYTEFKMFKNKFPQYSGDANEYSLRPNGSSPLSYELNGQFAREMGYSRSFSSSIDVLTGERAIDESAQLGSIGSANENLRGRDLTNIDSIDNLDIKTHPWSEMTGSAQPEVPAMFSVVPKDYFALYFGDLDKLGELEKTIEKLSNPLEALYSLSETAEIKEKIFNRLGIKDSTFFRKFIAEAVFVSYDLDPYPAADYALILKLKADVLENALRLAIDAPAGNQSAVGEYYVVATDKAVINDIKEAHSNKSDSLASAPDLLYSLSILESNFDAMAYISEALIQKLTSPAYRINAARRNAIVDALEVLQYTSFAYRKITGAWPRSFNQIIAEKYINADKVAHIEDYSIDARGVVQHAVWGNIYNIKPVNRVPITNATPNEISRYERFKDGYQDYWQEFIDPVGIAITIGDQIKFHTIILPLIEESSYNTIMDISGGEAVEFDFILDPDKDLSVQLISKIDVDSILYAIYKDSGRQFDEVYQECRDDFYSINFQQRRGLSITEECPYEEKSRDEGIALLKEKAAEWLDMENRAKTIFDFIGNEGLIGIGESFQFSFYDFTNFDFVLGIELTDEQRAKEVIEKTFKKILEESGVDQGDVGMLGLLGVGGARPIKNSYKDHEFYMLPTGFINLFYIFLNDRLYLSISQIAINKLIDGQSPSNSDSKQAGDNAKIARVMDYLGYAHSLLFLIDGEKSKPIVSAMVKDNWSSYSSTQHLRSNAAYYKEALAMASTFDNYDGTLSSSGEYYHYPPERWLDSKFRVDNGQIYLTMSSGSEYSLDQIDFGARYSYFNSPTDTTDDDLTDIADLSRQLDVESLLDGWDMLEALGIGLSITEHGLDIKLAFNNTEQSDLDPRYAPGSGQKKNNSSNYFVFIYIATGVAVLVIIGIAVAKKLSNNPNPTNEDPADNSADSEPTLPSSP